MIAIQQQKKNMLVSKQVVKLINKYNLSIDRESRAYRYAVAFNRLEGIAVLSRFNIISIDEAVGMVLKHKKEKILDIVQEKLEPPMYG